jgi:hypothetical protein
MTITMNELDPQMLALAAQDPELLAQLTGQQGPQEVQGEQGVGRRRGHHAKHKIEAAFANAQSPADVQGLQQQIDAQLPPESPLRKFVDQVAGAKLQQFQTASASGTQTAAPPTEAQIWQ